MGIVYVVMGVLLAGVLTVVLDLAAGLANVPASETHGADVVAALGLIVIPFAAMAGLIVTTPVYLLFVNDKNSGVLEYLLAVGMGQRDIFKGYLKAALLLSLVAMVPAVLLNLALSPDGLVAASKGGALALVTGAADVAMVTVLMTGFSSMQRRPTGMNSPLGIGIGVFIMLPEMVLFSVLGTAVIWLDIAVAAVVLATAVTLLAFLDRLIRREKLLP